MKILMVCGSPRHKNSTSQYLLQGLKEKINDGNEILMGSISNSYNKTVEVVGNNIADTKAIVLAFPLYVDGIPSSFLKFLVDIEKVIKQNKTDCKVYALINNGFYDAKQNDIAIDMIMNWCKKCGMKMGYAIGVGGGEMAQVTPLGQGPSTNLGKAVDQLAVDILEGKSGERIFVEPNFPRFLYKIAAHYGWRKQVKENGLNSSDIKRRE